MEGVTITRDTADRIYEITLRAILIQLQHHFSGYERMAKVVEGIAYGFGYSPIESANLRSGIEKILIAHMTPSKEALCRAAKAIRFSPYKVAEYFQLSRTTYYKYEEDKLELPALCTREESTVIKDFTIRLLDTFEFLKEFDGLRKFYIEEMSL